MQNISFENAYSQGFKFGLLGDCVGGAASSQRQNCSTYNHYSDTASVSPAATLTADAAVAVLRDLGIIGHQHKLQFTGFLS